MPGFEYNTTAPAFKGFNLNLTLLMVFDLVKGIVADFGPDHKGNRPDGCLYATEETDGRLVASCIVGQVFDRLGILRVLIGDPNIVACAIGINTDNSGIYKNLSAINERSFTDHLAQFGIVFEPNALTFLKSMQGHQDGGMGWGEAFECASLKVADLMEDPRTGVQRLDSLLGA